MFRYATIAALVFLSGCSLLNPSVRSSRELTGTTSHVLTTDATLRHSYILYDQNKADGSAIKGLAICPEPQPDAATQLAAKGALTGSGGRVGTEASAEALLEYQSSVIQLAGRSSTVLLARDFLFNVCVLRANGYLDNAQVEKLASETIELVRDIAARDKVQAIADASRDGVPADVIASALAYTPERDSKIVDSASALSKLNDEAERRRIVEKAFGCEATATTCIASQNSIIAQRDVNELIIAIARLSPEKIIALHAALKSKGAFNG